jgi:hypothetical protein
MYNILFLGKFLALHVSDVTASIVRSTTVVYSHRYFMVLVYLFHGVDNGFVTLCHCSTVSFRLVWNWPCYSDSVPTPAPTGLKLAVLQWQCPNTSTDWSETDSATVTVSQHQHRLVWNWPCYSDSVPTPAPTPCNKHTKTINKTMALHSSCAM